MPSLLKASFCNGFFATIVFVLISGALFIPNLPSFGHLYGYNIQEWKNPKDDILIQFDAEPETPSMGKNTTLNFSVQDLQTRKHLTNLTETTKIIYLNEQNPSANDITYKFNTNKVQDGDFSHSYVFEKGGTYEIFLRIDTTNFIGVSKFVIFVSSPQFQIMNLVYLLLPFIIFSGILIVIGIVIWRYIYRKR